MLRAATSMPFPYNTNTNTNIEAIYQSIPPVPKPPRIVDRYVIYDAHAHGHAYAYAHAPRTYTHHTRA